MFFERCGEEEKQGPPVYPDVSRGGLAAAYPHALPLRDLDLVA